MALVVVGAGISGVACARELADAGREVVVLDRGRAVGGRMASRTVDGRPVDTGASYLTARSEPFLAVLGDWLDRGVARTWTDGFSTATRDGGLGGRRTGPVRYAGVRGQRSLVADLARGLDVRQERVVSHVGPGPTVDGEPAEAVVLAMPDPQAERVLDPALTAELAAVRGREWAPALALLAGWGSRAWPEEFDGAFVTEDAVLDWAADDGRRRGDGAPVLVAHSTPDFARPRLADPDAAAAELVGAVRELLRIGPEPQWARVHRWSFSKPVGSREADHHLGPARVGLCGDGWGSSRVETAYLSGRALGRALLERLG